LFLAFAGNAIQLVPDGTLIFHLILIILMVAILNATLLKPINRVLEERERQTRGRLSEAQSIVGQVDDKMRAYERQLREARSEGYSLLEQERTTLSANREQQLGQLRNEIADLLKHEKERLAAESQEVQATLKVEARDLAKEISQHILRRPLSGQANR
jgi:F-type H+-transporting ATPase subunit b